MSRLVDADTTAEDWREYVVNVHQCVFGPPNTPMISGQEVPAPPGNYHLVPVDDVLSAPCHAPTVDPPPGDAISRAGVLKELDAYAERFRQASAGHSRTFSNAYTQALQGSRDFVRDAPSLAASADTAALQEATP